MLTLLSNLPLAITEMFAIAALMALGMVIDQGEAPSYYFEKFPEDNPVFGFAYHFVCLREIRLIGKQKNWICQVSQFYSDLSLFDLDGKEVMRKTIKVYDPLRYGGVTIYQTDWGFSALQVKKNGEGPLNLAMAPLKLNGDKKLFGTFLPLEDSESSNVKGISMFARDLQSIVLYDQEGKFVGGSSAKLKTPN